MTKPEKSQIRQILQSPAWRTIENCANELINKIRDDLPERDTEWDTIKAVLSQSGRVQGIKSFIQELYEQAKDA